MSFSTIELQVFQYYRVDYAMMLEERRFLVSTWLFLLLCDGEDSSHELLYVDNGLLLRYFMMHIIIYSFEQCNAVQEICCLIYVLNRFFLQCISANECG